MMHFNDSHFTGLKDDAFIMIFLSLVPKVFKEEG
jgi:hypothetical protein